MKQLKPLFAALLISIAYCNVLPAQSHDADNSTDSLNPANAKVAAVLGPITGFTPGNGEFIFASNTTKVKVSYYRYDIFRIQLAPTGTFKQNTDSLLALHPNAIYTNVTSTDAGTYYKLETDSCVLRAYKNPFKFALYKKNNATLIWQEQSPLNFGTSTVQQIQSDPTEYFYGCGMQNGYFSHKNRSIKIEIDFSNSWGIGAVSNPSPFFMSTKGYGMFRNTFAPGKYDFMSTLNLSHSDSYFDSYYFCGGSLKKVLDGYTYITGRPFMIPRWGLEFGDADCYNKTGVTMDVINKVAKVYRQNDMPGGWVLPDDGYGCGYQNLAAVKDSLAHYGFKTGLWTENPVASSAYEVGTAGVGVYKLDVALVGNGYKMALQNGLKAFNGIENNINKRGFIWTVAGWAGTHRFATIWSGDQSGTWSNVQMHIPTVIGSGLSAFNCATGDVDGIFGGANNMYVRDLQWKCFTPALMVISGWAQNNKQPYIYGGVYTTYNRNALKLKMRLTPYFYSYCRQANLTGVPTVRAMVLEFPNDTTTYSTTTQYQFMSGEWFLVAPVYTSALVRNNIYLPATKWIDYWDGTPYNGPMTLNNYQAPLSKLPLFVKAGAIIPMYPSMLYDNQKPKDTLTLDLYPYGNSAFALYEDDGFTKNYRTGVFAETSISLSGPLTGFAQPIIANISATNGVYSGMPASRSNKLDFHFPNKPGYAILNTLDTLTQYYSQSTYDAAVKGWYYNATDRHGMTHVKTGSISVNTAFEVKLINFSPTGIEEGNDFNSSVTVYPSPTSGSVTISMDNNIVLRAVRVYTSTGQEVSNLRPANKTAPVSFRINEKPGLYFIYMETNQGTIIRKVIVTDSE